MARAFGRNTPVLQPREFHRGRSSWLLWPALQYRVVTPLVEEPELNVFQRGILGLARCGERDPARWAELLGLETEFAQLVRDGLSTMLYLDAENTPTEAGLRSLEDGFADPTRIVVTHVYQDPFTGAVWPAHVENPMTVGVRWPANHIAGLDTAGAALRAIAVPGPDLGEVEPPDTAEILEQVSRGRRIEVWGEHVDRWRRRGPARITARVSVLDSGEPVYIPVQIAVSQPKGGERSWNAINPFTGQRYERLRRSILNRCATHDPLSRELQRLIGRPSEARLTEFEQLQTERKSLYLERLDSKFGSGLHEHPELAELLTLVELHWDNANASVDNHADLELTVNYAWRSNEVLLRSLPESWKIPPWPDSSPGVPPWRKLLEVCSRIGLEGNEFRILHGFFNTNQLIKKALGPVEKSEQHLTNPQLMLFAIVSADAHGADHPVRRLIVSHPFLLTEWCEASDARNSGSHAAITRTAVGRAESARQLAFELTECFVQSLRPSAERKETPPHGQPQVPQQPQGNEIDADRNVSVGRSGP